MPSAEVMDSVPANAANTKAENAKSIQVLDELLSKLTLAKSADETNAAAGNIASFINGNIEEHDAPTK
jgi:elongation factor 3